MKKYLIEGAVLGLFLVLGALTTMAQSKVLPAVKPNTSLKLDSQGYIILVGVLKYTSSGRDLVLDASAFRRTQCFSTYAAACDSVIHEFPTSSDKHLIRINPFLLSSEHLFDLTTNYGFAADSKSKTIFKEILISSLGANGKTAMLPSYFTLTFETLKVK